MADPHRRGRAHRPATGSPTRGRPRRGPARRRPRRSRTPTPRSPPEGRALGRRARPAPHRRRASPTSPGAGPSWSAIESGTVDPGGAVGPRPARGAGPRLGRRCTSWSATTASTSTDPAVGPADRGRGDDPLFRSSAVRTPEGHLSFVYKAAAEIGELGDNTAALRAAIPADDLLRLALARRPARRRSCSATPAGRASASSPSPTPTRSTARGRRRRTGPTSPPRSTATSTTSPTSRPPTACASRPRSPPTPRSSRRSCPAAWPRASTSSRPSGDTVASFEGSVAIAASAAADPDQLLLALRGSGQALYVGLAEDCYVVASEPYGLVEVTRTYLRMDGETPADPDNPTASRGQIVVLDGGRAGTLDGIARLAYDGTALPVADDELQHGPDHHPRHRPRRATPTSSSRRSPRRPVLPQDAAGQARRAATARCRCRSGDDVLRPTVRERPARRPHRPRSWSSARARPRSPARAWPRRSPRCIPDGRLRVEALPATELSGFGLRADMGDTLVVAISQSGTTTDTNRTVDLVRARGATVIGHRQPPQQRPHRQGRRRALHVRRARRGDERGVDQGVLRPDRGRLPAGLAPSPRRSGGAVEPDRSCRARATCPPPWRPRVDAAGPRSPAPPSSSRPAALLGDRRQRHQPHRRRGAADQAAASSATSRSPATPPRTRSTSTCRPSRSILVCAAGLAGSTADDVAKEVAIYRAHKAAPIVIATDGEERFAAALHVIRVPPTAPAARLRARRHGRPPVRLRGGAGHRRPGPPAARGPGRHRGGRRRARRRPTATACCARCGRGLSRVGGALLRRPAQRRLRRHLEASTAVRLASLLRYAARHRAARRLPGRARQGRHAGGGGRRPHRRAHPGHRRADPPGRRHQAPGQDRHRRHLPHRRDAARRRRWCRRCWRPARPATGSATGRCAPSPTSTRRSPRSPAGSATRSRATPRTARCRRSVVDRGGIALDIPSRTERTRVLRGTKHTGRASSGRCSSPGAASDGRTVVIVPEMKDDQATGLTLLHVRFADRLPVAAARGVLQGYRDRCRRSADAVTETEPTFREDLLADRARRRPAGRADQRAGRPLAV